MTTKQITKLLILPLLIVFSFAVSSCSESEGSEKSSKNSEDNTRAVSVETLELKGTNYIDYINVIGTLKPLEKASLSYQTGGIIKEIVKDKGEKVSAGETIVIIDNDVLKANLDGAKANFELAEVTFQKQEKYIKIKSTANTNYSKLSSEEIRQKQIMNL